MASPLRTVDGPTPSASSAAIAFEPRGDPASRYPWTTLLRIRSWRCESTPGSLRGDGRASGRPVGSRDGPHRAPARRVRLSPGENSPRHGRPSSRRESSMEAATYPRRERITGPRQDVDVAQPPAVTPTADPGPLGLAAFALTT